MKIKINNIEYSEIWQVLESDLLKDELSSYQINKLSWKEDFYQIKDYLLEHTDLEVELVNE